MGVPKFTRFICERYPCLLEVLNEYQIPEFDNLYLDMNGIIHCCSHPNDGDAHFRITEETIFKNIFLYVEILFRTIKPQKLFFMAIDGVAPRAKINQQRSRRFKSAKEAQIVENKARANGEVLPKEPRFDSNCITPGTEFMAKLTELLRYFVIYKISTDKLWQKCKVILSGPEVPGEGEHKIMDYIRYMKSQPSYDPNLRHCLYGLDADLVMLSLCTHEPHFAVLREEVIYGRSSEPRTPPEKIKFCLLHVSLLREYMEHEFESLKPILPFPFDLEKIIDDWILMGFLIGNDFIPHLPTLHIAKGALPILYAAYKETLPTLDGYINEAGILNLGRFEKFMEKLSSIDVQHFSEHQADLKYFESKTGRRVSENDGSTPQINSPSHNPLKKSFKKDLESLIQSTDDLLLGHSSEEDELLSNDSDTQTYALEFLQHKQDYYLTKFHYDEVDAEVMREQATAYVTAIQWNLHYYYNGCCSWSWFYPHHYAPFISDIKDFKDLKLDFERGTPFLPFQQLLAVLPAASKGLLPEAYQHLLTDEESPIISYYPDDFKVDLNEKTQSWEAIVLIPFINEKELLDAMEPCNAKLTPEEQKRNRHGPMSIITFIEKNLGKITAPAYFPTIENHAVITLVDPKEIDVPREKLKKGILERTKLNVYNPGFPTLQYIKHEVKLEKAKVKIFEHPSSYENMIVTILPKKAPGIQQLANDLLGKIVYVKWPHLLEAQVIGVSDCHKKIFLINLEKPYIPENVDTADIGRQDEVQWRAAARDFSMGCKSRFGIVTGDIDVLIRVRVITGRRYIFTKQGRMSLEKEWSSVPSYYPYQSIVQDIEVEQSGNISHRNISDIYTPKSICFMLGHPHYGAMGEVVEPGVILKTGRVKVAMNITPEPDFLTLKIEQERTNMQYMYGSIVARRLSISSHLVSRITGTIFLKSSEKPTNIGLNLKFNKRNEQLPGYTKKVCGQWVYSTKAVGLIRSYMEEFPKLFEKLVENIGNDVFNEQDLFSWGGDVKEVVKWLEKQPFRKIRPSNCDAMELEPDIINLLQAQVDEFVEKNENAAKTVIMQVKPHLLFKPGINCGNIPPDTRTENLLFDRIISVNENSSVPLGYKGTIIKIHRVNGSTSDNVFEVLFDKPFVGGIFFDGEGNSRRTQLHDAEFINITWVRNLQDNARITSAPEKAKEGSEGALNSAFASFTAQGNFSPVSGNGTRPNRNQGAQVAQMKGQGVKKEVRKGARKEVKEQEHRQGQVLGQVQGRKESTPAEPEVKSETNTEFQMLWNELQKNKVPKSVTAPFPQMSVPMPQPMPPCIPEPPQDPTAFLKAVLKIPNEKSSDQSKPAPDRRCFPQPPTPASPSNAPRPNTVTLVQLMFDHARQAREENVSYCARLLNHYQLMGVGMPRYFYSSQKNLVHAQIVLPDMRMFYGDLCTNHRQAAESAAKKALNELNLSTETRLRSYFHTSPPNAWLNVQPPVNVQAPVMMSPRFIPDAQKPPVRPPANWSVNKPYQSPGFTQVPPPRMDHPIEPAPGTSHPEPKEIKQKAPFVPLQAQKKTASRHPKEKSQESHKAKENDQNKVGKDNLVTQKNQRNPRQRKSRIAANFGSSAANGRDQ